MGRPRTALKIGGAIVGAIVLILVLLVVLVTNTPWGRERVRDFALGRLAEQVAGNVTVGEIDGNLLSGARIAGIEITDSSGAPFLAADTLALSYSLRSILSKRLVFRDVEVVNPTIVLNQPPGGEWNFVRLFPQDTSAVDTVPGFGSWVRFEDLTIRNGTLVVRSEWTPPDSLQEEAREEAIREALSPQNRQWVIPAANGYQAMMLFRDLDARLPLVRIAHPDSAARVFDVASLSATAYPFRPPAAQIRDLAGNFVLTEDSLHFTDARLTMPDTRAAAEGSYALGTGGLTVRLTANPLQFDDLEWVRPGLPAGGGRLAATVRRDDDVLNLLADSIDLRSGDAAISGHLRVQLGNEFRLGDSELAFADVSTSLIRELAPDLSLPVSGSATGQLAARGEAEALDVDGWAEFRRTDGSVSRVVADGEVGSGDGFRAEGLQLTLEPLQLDLLRTFVPDLPLQGYLTGSATLTGSTTSQFRMDADLVHSGPAAGRSRLLANGTVLLGDEIRARELRLRFEPMQLAAVRIFAPSLELGGYLTGSADLSGSADDLSLTADLVHVDPAAGRSRLLADGTISLENGFGARGLDLRADPLRIGVARAFFPELPIDGTIAGSATLSGSTQTRLAAGLDLTLDTETGTSHLIGEAVVAPDAGPRFDVDLRAPVLSLATVGEFAPAAGLRGSARGAVEASGTPSDLSFSADLTFSDGGAVAADGRLSLGASELGYEVDASMDAFDGSVVSSRLPRTALSGFLAAQGTGTDPETMNAALQARLADVVVEGNRADSTIVDAVLANGLATVERAQVHLASATAEIDGEFGLTEGRSGTLRYTLTVDTLSQFSGWVAGDSAPIQPRPVLQARRIAEARADSLRRYRETEVERAATGYPPPPALNVDSLPPLPADSLGGSIRAEGVIAGNIERFDTRGALSASDFIAAGFAADTAFATYEAVGLGTSEAAVDLDLAGRAIRARGFAFDSTAVRADYEGVFDRGVGSVDVVVYQDTLRDYRLRSDFVLELDRSEILLNDLALRFDTVTWTAPHPSEIRWASDGLAIDSLELVSTGGGSILMDGDLPAEGEVDLRLAVDGLAVGQVVALLQDTVQAAGILDLQANVRGTRAAPNFQGTASLRESTYAQRELPDARATFAYADAALDAELELTDELRSLLVAEAELPIDLTLGAVEGGRLLDAPLLIEARMDSLPLEALPSFTETVRDVRGRLRGELTVRGTFDEPRPQGVVDLDLASLDVVPVGVGLRDIMGVLRIEPNVLVLDSLVATSGGGPIRADGRITLETLLEPAFDLAVSAEEADVLDNERGRVRADAELDVSGTLDSLVVAGQVAVVEGMLYAPEMDSRRATELDDPTIAAVVDTLLIGEEDLRPVNPLLDALHLDVDVSISRNTWVRNSDANVEIYTPDGSDPLQVRMVPGSEIDLEGVINADRGEYSFSGRIFELTTGSVTFLGGPELNPLLQLTARYQVPRAGREALDILIHITGSMTEPRITLESTAQPPLSQSDLLAFLAFGRSSSSLLSQDGSGVTGGDGIGALAQQQIAGLALGAVMDEVVSDVERQGTRAGLDVFRVRPAELPEELAFSGYLQNFLRGTELVAGKYFGGRLFLAAQGRPTAQVWPGLRVEYVAERGFSLEASWEPRFLPAEPTLVTQQEATQTRTFGTFLFWRDRF